MSAAKQQNNALPNLDRPGAGLPWFQVFALRWIIAPWIAGRSSTEKSAAYFRSVTEKILQEIDGLSEEQLTRQVLISPMAGIEDSSRYWSVAMTLEHIMVVGKNLAVVIQEAAHGRMPPGEIDIAKLKPEGKTPTAKLVESFKAFCHHEFAGILRNAQQGADSKIKFLHPWMGPMNVRQWLWVLASHHELHLKQIRAIKKGL